MLVPQQTLICFLKRFSTAMHSGKMCIRHLFRYGQLSSRESTNFSVFSQYKSECIKFLFASKHVILTSCQLFYHIFIPLQIAHCPVDPLKRYVRPSQHGPNTEQVSSYVVPDALNST